LPPVHGGGAVESTATPAAASATTATAGVGLPASSPTECPLLRARHDDASVHGDDALLA
jgi:hypothetical protein